MFNTYVSTRTRNLVHVHEQQYVKAGEDEVLVQAVYIKEGMNPELMRLEDVLKMAQNCMQTQHKVQRKRINSSPS